MKQIEIKKLDALHNLILELSCVAYLQSVIQYDNYSMDSGSDDVWEETKNYSVDKEVEIVESLRELTQTNDFAFTIK